MATSPETYRQCALSQLREAREGFAGLAAEDWDNSPCAAAAIAGQIWKAALYGAAVSYQLETGGQPNGKSTQLGGYIERKYGKGDALWGPVNRLHNFELKPEQPRLAFVESCRYAGAFLARLNADWPARLQIPAESLQWLVNA